MPSRLPPPPPRPKQGPFPPPAFSTGLLGTMDPSDSRPARPPFALGLWGPPAPNVGRRDGSLLSRVELLSACPPPCPAGVLHRSGSGCSLLPSPRHDRLGRPPFRVPISRGCKVRFMLGLPTCSPPADLWPAKGFRRPAQTARSPSPPGACYAALRRLPRRVSLPLARRSLQDATLVGLRRGGACAPFPEAPVQSVRADFPHTAYRWSSQAACAPPG